MQSKLHMHAQAPRCLQEAPGAPGSSQKLPGVPQEAPRSSPRLRTSKNQFLLSKTNMSKEKTKNLWKNKKNKITKKNNVWEVLDWVAGWPQDLPDIGLFGYFVFFVFFQRFLVFSLDILVLLNKKMFFEVRSLGELLGASWGTPGSFWELPGAPGASWRHLEA